MPNPFFIEVDDEKLKSLFEKLSQRGRDMRPALLAIGNVVANSVRRNFDEGGRPDKWKSLSEATLIGSLRGKDFDKRKKTKTLTTRASKRIASRKILVGLGMRGGLMGSIHYEVDGNGVSIGPEPKPYARIHQFGGEAGRKSHRVKIPARPYLVLQQEDVQAANNIIIGFLMRE